MTNEPPNDGGGRDKPAVRFDPHAAAAGQTPPGQVPAIYDPLHAYDVREDEFDLRTMWRTVVKYRLTIAVVTLVVVLTTFFASLMMLPVYRSTATIEITPNPNQVVKLENVDQGGSTGKGYLETEFNIIRSSSVGRAVIEALQLWNEPEINGRLQQRGIRTGLSQLKRVLFGGPAQQQVTNRTPETEEELERLVRSSLGAYGNRLGVRLVRGSYLFEISFESFDPELAANVANTVVEEYMRLNDERRFASTGSARDFLTEEIQRAQGRLETSERDLYDFARRFQVVDVEDTNNIMSSRLESLNSELSRVRSERIRAESLLLQAEATPPESLPQLLDEPLVVQLKNDYAALQGEYIRLSEIFKDKYPRIQQLKAEMAQVERSLAQEIDKQVVALGVDFEQLQRREELLTREVASLKDEIFDLQDRAVQYNILKREWEANKELYAGLLDRMKEVGVASGLEVNNVSVIDRAVVPGGPFKPNLKNNVAKAGMLGLMGGIALAFLLAFLDNTVRTAEQLEQLLHLASLGLVPMIRGRDPTSIAEKRKSKTHRGDRMDVKRLDLMSHLKRDNELGGVLSIDPDEPDVLYAGGRAPRARGYQRQQRRGQDHSGGEPCDRIRPERGEGPPRRRGSPQASCTQDVRRGA